MHPYRTQLAPRVMPSFWRRAWSGYEVGIAEPCAAMVAFWWAVGAWAWWAALPTLAVLVVGKLWLSAKTFRALAGGRREAGSIDVAGMSADFGR